MRYREWITQRYKLIISNTGSVLVFLSIVILVPMCMVLFYPGEAGYIDDFLIPALLLFAAGIVMNKALKPGQNIFLNVQEGGVVVLLSWIIACLVSAFPFMSIIHLTFTQAVFESVSGWTTTGLSVVDVTTAPHIILFWRSLMQLVGGAGFAIIMLAAIAGPTGPGLTSAEGRQEQLVPQVKRSASIVTIIYLGYTAFGVLAYYIAGMDFFDSVNHAFAAISTGGFSTVPESIGHWNSIPIVMVTMILMMAGNLNFLTAYLLLKGKLLYVLKNGEVRTVMVLLPAAAAITFFLLPLELYPEVSNRIVIALFESFSALTTTGFSLTSYSQWNSASVFILIMLMLIGGGTCSTAGGIKQYRVYLLFKSLAWELKRPFLPENAVAQHYIWQGEQRFFINNDNIKQVSMYVFLYALTYATGVLILTASGYRLHDSLFEFASSLSTVGLSVGVTSAGTPATVLWTETLGMFLGRLEFFVIIISLMKIVRDIMKIRENDN